MDGSGVRSVLISPTASTRRRQMRHHDGAAAALPLAAAGGTSGCRLAAVQNRREYTVAQTLASLVAAHQRSATWALAASDLAGPDRASCTRISTSRSSSIREMGEMGGVVAAGVAGSICLCPRREPL
jgi:hypothetical protein